jgi:Zn-dependent M28 family amino/carboxypeptidase
LEGRNIGLDRRLAAIALLGGVFLCACAAPHRRVPQSNDLEEAAFRQNVARLASDEFEGRRPGTAGETKTVGLLAAKFQALGLKPGNGASYLQAVPMIEVLPAADAALTVSGHSRIETLRYAKDVVIWTKRAEPLASLRRSDLVFAGYGIVAPEFGWNDYAGIDVHGKTVLVLTSDPGHATHDPRVFHGDSMTSYGRWSYKVEEAARQGASGILLIHDAGASGLGWQAVVDSFTRPQLDAATPGSADHPVIEGWLTADAGRALFAQAGLDFAALSLAAATPGFKAVVMGLGVDAEVHSSIRTLTSSNVIAVLPGRTRRREYLVYMAHWDHLGRAGGLAGAPIYPGAVDNASGTAGLLMLAQAFARTQPAPERTMVFLAVTGGESGLLGSDWYAAHPPFPLSDTVAVLNLDALRIGGPTRDVTVFGYGQSELDGFIRDAAALQGRELHPDPTPEKGLYFRSDHYSFAKRGVPVVYAKGGIDDSARGPAYGRALLENYEAHRYRQPSDTYAADWDVRGTLEDLRLYYSVGLRLSQTRRFPNWYPASEFRGIRDRSRDAD